MCPGPSLALGGDIADTDAEPLATIGVAAAMLQQCRT
jgi:hypothetical protein